MSLNVQKPEKIIEVEVFFTFNYYRSAILLIFIEVLYLFNRLKQKRKRLYNLKN